MPEYPYMPSDRHLKYVPHDHPHMVEACRAREECAGDPLWPVGIVAVRPALSGVEGDGQVVARAGNGFNRGPQENHVCPRIVLDCQSGEGYELCHVHDPPGHSEPQLVKVCQEAGIDTQGLDAYMYGHWWACQPCWQSLIDAGFRDLYVTNDAHERFTKEKVYGETLKPSIHSVSFSDVPVELADELVIVCTELGCQVVMDGEARAAGTPQGLDVFLAGEDKPVYQIVSHDRDRLARMLKNVLRQL